MTDLWRIRSSAHTSLHTGVAKLAASMTASAHRGQAELREPYTDADAHAALHMVTQNSLPMQRYCNRATTSCKVYATVTSLVGQRGPRRLHQSQRNQKRAACAWHSHRAIRNCANRAAQRGRSPPGGQQRRHRHGLERERSTPLNGRRASFFH